MNSRGRFSSKFVRSGNFRSLNEPPYSVRDHSFRRHHSGERHAKSFNRGSGDSIARFSGQNYFEHNRERSSSHGKHSHLKSPGPCYTRKNRINHNLSNQRENEKFSVKREISDDFLRDGEFLVLNDAADDLELQFCDDNKPDIDCERYIERNMSPLIIHRNFEREGSMSASLDRSLNNRSRSPLVLRSRRSFKHRFSRSPKRSEFSTEKSLFRSISHEKTLQKHDRKRSGSIASNRTESKKIKIENTDKSVEGSLSLIKQQIKYEKERQKLLEHQNRLLEKRTESSVEQLLNDCKKSTETYSENSLPIVSKVVEHKKGVQGETIIISLKMSPSTDTQHNKLDALYSEVESEKSLHKNSSPDLRTQISRRDVKNSIGNHDRIGMDLSPISQQRFGSKYLDLNKKDHHEDRLNFPPVSLAGTFKKRNFSLGKRLDLSPISQNEIRLYSNAHERAHVLSPVSQSSILGGKYTKPCNLVTNDIFELSPISQYGSFERREFYQDEIFSPNSRSASFHKTDNNYKMPTKQTEIKRPKSTDSMLQFVEEFRYCDRSTSSSPLSITGVEGKNYNRFAKSNKYYKYSDFKPTDWNKRAHLKSDHVKQISFGERGLQTPQHTNVYKDNSAGQYHKKEMSFQSKPFQLYERRSSFSTRQKSQESFEQSFGAENPDYPQNQHFAQSKGNSSNRTPGAQHGLRKQTNLPFYQADTQNPINNQYEHLQHGYGHQNSQKRKTSSDIYSDQRINTSSSYTLPEKVISVKEPIQHFSNMRPNPGLVESNKSLSAWNVNRTDVNSPPSISNKAFRQVNSDIKQTHQFGIAHQKPSFSQEYTAPNNVVKPYNRQGNVQRQVQNNPVNYSNPNSNKTVDQNLNINTPNPMFQVNVGTQNSNQFKGTKGRVNPDPLLYPQMSLETDQNPHGYLIRDSTKNFNQGVNQYLERPFSTSHTLNNISRNENHGNTFYPGYNCQPEPFKQHDVQTQFSSQEESHRPENPLPLQQYKTAISVQDPVDIMCFLTGTFKSGYKSALGLNNVEYSTGRDTKSNIIDDYLKCEFVPNAEYLIKYKDIPPPPEILGTMLQKFVIFFDVKKNSDLEKDPFMVIQDSFSKSNRFGKLDVEERSEIRYSIYQPPSKEVCVLRWKGVMLARAEASTREEARHVASISLINALAQTCYTVQAKYSYYCGGKLPKFMLNSEEKVGVYKLIHKHEMIEAVTKTFNMLKDRGIDHQYIGDRGINGSDINVVINLIHEFFAADKDIHCELIIGGKGPMEYTLEELKRLSRIVSQNKFLQWRYIKGFGRGTYTAVSRKFTPQQLCSFLLDINDTSIRYKLLPPQGPGVDLLLPDCQYNPNMKKKNTVGTETNNTQTSNLSASER